MRSRWSGSSTAWGCRLWRAAADGLFDEGGNLGEFFGVAQPHEFCAGLDQRQDQGSESGCGATCGSSPPRGCGCDAGDAGSSLLAGGVSKQTHDSIVAQIDAAGNNGAQVKADNATGARKPWDAAVLQK